MLVLEEHTRVIIRPGVLTFILNKLWISIGTSDRIWWMGYAHKVYEVNNTK